MIKFFRHVRRELMESNKTGKYLKYAIGEIVLVVIGILIALSINNWNINRIAQKEINDSLSQILNDLRQDNETLEYFHKMEAEHITYLTNVSTGNYNSVGLDTLLISLDHYMYFSRSNNGYSNLKETGKISTIKDIELKDALTNYYEYTYEMLSAASHYAETFTNNRVIPYSIDHLKANLDFLTTDEIVKEKLDLTNLRYLINYQINVKNYTLNQVKRAQQINNDLAMSINSELEN